MNFNGDDRIILKENKSGLSDWRLEIQYGLSSRSHDKILKYSKDEPTYSSKITQLFHGEWLKRKI